MKERVQLKPLISEQQIKERIPVLAKEIVTDFRGESLTVIGILNGSFLFLADLVRELNKNQLPLYVDFIRVSSYGSGQVSTGKPKIYQKSSLVIRDSHILVVDDILDTGLTLHSIINDLKRHHALCIKSCVCLDKPDRRKVSIRADYVGFVIPDAFVVGYGLDYDGRFREMPSISILLHP